MQYYDNILTVEAGWLIDNGIMTRENYRQLSCRARVSRKRTWLQGIKQNAALLEKIAVERIRVEFEKLLMGQNPVAGLNEFLQTGLYQYCPGLVGKQTELSGLLLLNNWQ